MSDLIALTIARIALPDGAVAVATERRLDQKTKPRRSLGLLEGLACQIAAARGTSHPEMPRKVMLVLGADHGVTEEGVSAYPAEVTVQMLLNFARGGAAINVLARQVGAELRVVNMGTRHPVPEGEGTDRLVDRRIGPGTANFTRGPAMTRAQATQAVTTGIELAQGLVAEGFTLIGLGEMGIGNSTAASALAAVLLDLPPQQVVGSGTGITSEALLNKIDVVARGLAHHRPDRSDPLGVLAQVGGFEIAGLVGVILGAAAAGVPVVVDGFITAAAALAAARLAPVVVPYLIAGHQSVEPGHGLILRALAKPPLLDLQMRLGEGTGAALAMGLCDAAVRLLREMATFDGAGVTDSGR